MGIYVWGTGCGASELIRAGLEPSRIAAFLDNAPSGPSFQDRPVIRPEQLKAEDAELLIVTARAAEEIARQCAELGIPEELVFRQPFPGPGLGVRIVGEVTADKVRIVQDADAIYREEIAKAGLDREINQYFAALTNMRSVGVMGDERTYDYAVALRAVKTIDFMTAEAAEIPFDVLQKVMSRIINEVKGVNRLFYDLTSKPPGTIELE